MPLSTQQLNKDSGILETQAQVEEILTEEETTLTIINRISANYSSTTTEIVRAINVAENSNGAECNLEIGCRGGIGPMMFVQSTFDEQCEGDVYTDYDNIACGFKLIDKGELYRWKQSAWNMSNHAGWLERLSTTTRAYALNILREKALIDCSCVTYMRELGHVFAPVPDPSYMTPNTVPAIGVMILLDFKLPHVGEVMDLRPKILFYKERILIGDDCFTRVSWIAYDDERIRGYVK